MNESRTFTYKRDAEAWGIQREGEIDRGILRHFNREAERVTLGELFDRYQEEMTPGKKSWRREAQRLKLLHAVFGKTKLASLEAKDITVFREKRLKGGIILTH